MNNVQIDPRNLIYVSLATASQEDPEGIVSSDVLEALQYKTRDKDTGVMEDADYAKLYYGANAHLSPVYGKVVGIGLGYVPSKGGLTTKFLWGEEKEMIAEAYDMLTTGSRTLTGYGIMPYGLPFLRTRALHHGISVPPKYNDMGLKPWGMENRVLDLMTYIKGGGYNLSLAEACMVFGIEPPLLTEQVNALYHEGNKDVVEKHCLDLVNIYHTILERTQI